MVKLNICTLCDYSTNDNSNWSRHVKTQKHLANKEKLTQKLCCKYCKKQFTRTDNRKVHEKKCKSNDTNTDINNTNDNTDDNTDDNTERKEIVNNDNNNDNNNVNTINDTNMEKLFKKITDLEQTIAQSKPAAPVIQNTPNLEPLTEKVFAEHLVNLRLDFIQDGGKGYASFASIYSLKDKIICTDKSRKKIRYCNSQGEIVNDYGGVQLCQLFFQNISQHNAAIIDAEYNRLQKEVQQIADEGRAGVTDVTAILNKSIRLQNILDQSLKAAKGDQNQLTQDFIRNLVKNLK